MGFFWPVPHQNASALEIRDLHAGTAERWSGSRRRGLLEQVVVPSEGHLIRLVRSYISYYHEDRCHWD